MSSDGSRRLTRRRLLQLAASLPVATMGGCSMGSSTPLRIAVQPWCGYQFIRLADEEGWLSSDIELAVTRTAVESIRRIKSGEAEGAALTLDQVMTVVDDGVPLEIVLIVDVSAGADVLLVQPDITSLADLRGKRIGAEATSLGTVMLEKLLEAAGLQRSDVTVVPMTEHHVQSWNEHEMDAVLTYEPALGKLRELGLVPLFDSRSLPQTIFDVVAVRCDAAPRHASQLRQLVAGHFRALDLWRTNPIDTAFRLAPLMQVPVERVQGTFTGIDLPDEEYNRHYLNGPSPDLLRTTADVAAIMQRAGMLRAQVDPRNLFTAEYLPRPAR
jgi:NitT/TauT family transport system substrate-binding protein